jgi:hypothetical protein
MEVPAGLSTLTNTSSGEFAMGETVVTTGGPKMSAGSPPVIYACPEVSTAIEALGSLVPKYVEYTNAEPTGLNSLTNAAEPAVPVVD